MSEYFKNIWLGIYTVLVGMGITFRHLFTRNVTNQYPDRWHPIKDKFAGKRTYYKGDPKRGEMPANSRNRIFVDMDLCNGCKGCERACPVNCITVETVKVVPEDPEVTPLKDGSKRGLWVTRHDIDFAKCCFCSLCTEPCPTNSIMMTTEFEYSTFDRNDLLYHFSIMTPEKVAEKTQMAEKAAAEKKKAAAAAKKAAPAKATPKKDDSGSEEE